MAIEPNSPTDRQVRALSHPALLVIRRTYDPKTKRFSQTIPVDEVRRLRTFLALSPESQGWRVVIVDSADDLNANAANALLKSLEEPPPRTIFLLITSAPGRLLTTIRSRCRFVAAGATCRDGLEARCRAGADDCREGRTGSARLGSAIASLAGKRAPRADT